jgi:hypothetical protein
MPDGGNGDKGRRSVFIGPQRVGRLLRINLTGPQRPFHLEATKYVIFQGRKIYLLEPRLDAPASDAGKGRFYLFIERLEEERDAFYQRLEPLRHAGSEMAESAVAYSTEKIVGAKCVAEAAIQSFSYLRTAVDEELGFRDLWTVLGGFAYEMVKGMVVAALKALTDAVVAALLAALLGLISGGLGTAAEVGYGTGKLVLEIELLWGALTGLKDLARLFVQEFKDAAALAMEGVQAAWGARLGNEAAQKSGIEKGARKIARAGVKMIEALLVASVIYLIGKGVKGGLTQRLAAARANLPKFETAVANTAYGPAYSRWVKTHLDDLVKKYGAAAETRAATGGSPASGGGAPPAEEPGAQKPAPKKTAPPDQVPKPKAEPEGHAKPKPQPKGTPANFGKAKTNDYVKTFTEAHPETKGKVVVHHAVEQQALKRYPGLVSNAEMHSLENLRGIPKSLNNDLHLSQIRKGWNQFYRNNPNPTRQQLLDHATKIDDQFGKLFDPPVR